MESIDMMELPSAYQSYVDNVTRGSTREYVVVTYRNEFVFESMVEALMQNGYTPQGGVFITPDKKKHQAMIKVLTPTQS